jgi:homoserine kinase
MYKIVSYATSANVGPGFDCLGICLSAANIFNFSEFEDAVVINNHADTLKNKENLIAKSFFNTADIIGKKFSGVKINVKTAIPLSRGLGSSASCITAGAAGAFLLSGITPVKSDLFEIAAEIEGHPDNVAPNIFGGGIISYESGGKYKCLGFKIDDKYRFLALIPNFRLSTQKARAILPETYKREDAVFNISRTAMLLTALQFGNDGLLNEALEDRLHQPYRKTLIKDYDAVIKICRDCGAAGTYLSGAGPTVMAVVTDDKTQRLIAKKLSESGLSWQPQLMRVNNDGIECFNLA